MDIKDLITVFSVDSVLTFPKTGAWDGGGGLVIAANDFAANASISLRNDGTLNYFNGGGGIVGGYFRATQTVEVDNHGTINVRGDYGVGLQGDGALVFHNSGTLMVEGQTGYSGGFAKASEAINSGLIQVHGANGGYGLQLYGGSLINAGTIRAYGGIGSYGVTFNGGNPAVPIYVLNTGLIAAEDGDPDRERAVGVHVANNIATIVNRGEISAEIAVEVYKNPGFPGYQTAFENSGVIHGRVSMGFAADTVRNSGSIQGDIELSDGNDLFDGRDGTVLGSVSGGEGFDTLIGTAGYDYLRGDAGDDSVAGGGGFDDINGNMGNDTAHGNDGDDWVVGGRDGDLLFGDAGGDIVYGNLGNDTQFGGDGFDWVRGGQGNDSLDGGAGDDWIWGDRGDDTVTGGAGADIFHFFSGAGLDRVTDFNYAQGDRVVVDYGTYTVSQVGADTVIDLGGGDRMVLVGVTVSSLPVGWITAL